jgi:hypothetical protein
MAGKGGYQAPANPAPVSGPGQLSQRTDGGPGKQPIRTPTGGGYGEAQQLTGLQQAAPLAESPGGGDTPRAALLAALGAGAGGGNVVGFNEPTQLPDVPVTDGAASGPGAGLEALNLSNQKDEDMQALLYYLPVFEMMANVPGSSRAMRNLVRQLKAQG